MAGMVLWKSGSNASNSSQVEDNPFSLQLGFKGCPIITIGGVELDQFVRGKKCLRVSLADSAEWMMTARMYVLQKWPTPLILQPI